MAIVRAETVPLDQLIPLCCLEIFSDHFLDQFLESHLRCPTQFGPGFGRVAQQRVDFGGSEVARIDADYGAARSRVDGVLVDTIDVTLTNELLAIAIPEPSSWVLLLGLLGTVSRLTAMRRRRKN